MPTSGLCEARRLRASCLVAVLATLCVLLWQAATVRYNFAGNWSALFCTGGAQRVPPELERGTHRSTHPDGYDGQFYRYIAHDPFFQKGYANYIDDARLRYRRILVPLAAWTLAAGRAAWIDTAFMLLVLVSVFAGAWWSSRYAVLRGRHPAWGLIFLAVPAVPTSADRMLVDATLAALTAGFLVAAGQGAARRMWVLCALACLTRETGLLLAGGVALDALRHRRWAVAVTAASSALPALAWWGFVVTQTPPSNAAHVNAGYPVLGIVLRLFTPRTLAPGLFGAALQVVEALAVVGLLASLVLAAWWAWRMKPGAVGIAILLFAALGSILSTPYYMLEAFGFARPVSPLLLFVLLEGVARPCWAALTPPLLVLMAVGINFAYPAWGILRGLARW
jgi:hypothetical protein